MNTSLRMSRRAQGPMDVRDATPLLSTAGLFASGDAGLSPIGIAGRDSPAASSARQTWRERGGPQSACHTSSIALCEYRGMAWCQSRAGARDRPGGFQLSREIPAPHRALLSAAVPSAVAKGWWICSGSPSRVGLHSLGGHLTKELPRAYHPPWKVVTSTASTNPGKRRRDVAFSFFVGRDRPFALENPTFVCYATGDLKVLTARSRSRTHRRVWH